MKKTGAFNESVIKQKFRLYGVDLVVLRNAIRGLSFYKNDFSQLKKQRGEDRTFALGKRFPILGERFTESGTMSGHYFHQDLLVARRIYENDPLKHVDIGSRTDGFVAHVAVFREIEIIDIRNQISKTNNIKFRRADLMELPQNMINAYDSISSLHAIEHFGLGRYGDPVDYFGHLKALDNIYKILQTGGKFYFSVPIGPQRIEFNAHRVFSVKYLLGLFQDKYSIDNFSYVNDKGDMFENVELSVSNIEDNFNCEFGCGIFEMTKI